MSPFSLLLVAFRFQGLVPPEVAVPQPPLAAQVLAHIGTEPVKASEVEAYLWDWRGSEVLQDVITARLVQEEASRVGVSISEADATKEYEDELTRMKASLQPNQDLDSSLRTNGYTRSRLFLRARTGLLLNRVSDKEMNLGDFVSVSTMVFKPKSDSATDLADAIQRADAARARVQKGEKWDDVLKASQQDPQLVAANGLLGWRPIAAFPEVTKPEFRAMKPGDISKSVQTHSGIQIFRLEEKGDATTPDQLTQLKSQFNQMTRSEILQRLRATVKFEKPYGGTG